MSDERRQFFRVRYPGVEQPTLTLAGCRCLVAELSEGGFRVRGDFSTLEEDQPIRATMRLLSGSAIKVTAVFSRRDGDEGVFEHLQGISFEEMMNEQRYLIRKYPSVRDDDADGTG